MGTTPKYSPTYTSTLQLQHSKLLKPTEPTLASNSSSSRFPMSVRGTIVILLTAPLAPHPQTLTISDKFY